MAKTKDTTTPESPAAEQRWVSLQIRNVLGAKAVKLTRNGPVTTIGGKNGQGKSSVIKAIWMALGGMAEMPDMPLREGATKGGTKLELTDYICELKLTAKSKPRIVIKAKDGSPTLPPATFLRALTAGRAYNPAGFYTEKPEKQLEILKKIARQDTSEIDAKRQAVFDRRTDVNRRCREIQAQLDSAPQHDNVPKKESTATELLEELKRRQEFNRQFDANTKLLQSLRSEAVEIKQHIAAITERLNEVTQRGKDTAKQLEGQQRLDEGEIAAQVDQLEENNRKVRENQRHAELLSEFEAVCDESENLTAEIAALDERKAEIISKTEWPIDGLGFGDKCVLYNARPLQQACGLERMRVSIAIGAALNPNLKLLTVDDEEKLDEDEHANLVKLAEESGYDLIVARVSRGEEVDVIIEDGEVAGDND